MKVKTKLNEQDLKEIAKSLDLQVLPEKQGNFINFTLKHPQSVIKKEKFVRKGFNGQKIHAVCLHGYTAFMIEILKKDKEAFFKSSMYPSKITISNISDAYDTLHGKNIGSLTHPLKYGDACFCDRNVEQIENEFYYLEE